MQTELSFQPRVIATGGLAEIMVQSSSVIEIVDEFLTLEGLRIVYSRNTKGGQDS